LEESGKTPQWHSSVDDVPVGATILIANEFLDALPVRQFEWRGGNWFERCVGVSDNGTLEYCSSPEPLDQPEIIPRSLCDAAQDGDMAEVRPQMEAIVESLAVRVQAAPTAALFIDYGHVTSATGETLQAVMAHDFTDPLEKPGEADLTAHVDFDQLGKVAMGHGLRIHGPLPQGEFLLALGLKERCERLMAEADVKMRETLSTGAKRLADPAQMGDLFKVMALTSNNLTPPPFTDTSEPEQDK
jgi:SAM-dependent MidA family methyltransferase